VDENYFVVAFGKHLTRQELSDVVSVERDRVHKFVVNVQRAEGKVGKVMIIVN
jgi:hypothetical protein